MFLPGFEVYCIAIISIEEADRLTYAGTPPSLRVEPTLKKPKDISLQKQMAMFRSRTPILKQCTTCVNFKLKL